MTEPSQHRIDVPLSVWSGIARPAHITGALVGRLTRTAEPALLVDCEADPTQLAASGRQITWICATRRAYDATARHLATLAPADRSRMRLRHVPRAALAEALAQYVGRFRLVVTGCSLTGQIEAWQAAIAALQPFGRLALIGADGTTGIPQAPGPVDLTYQAQIVCASTAAFDSAVTTAETIGTGAELPVALTRVHTPIALFTRAEGPVSGHA